MATGMIMTNQSALEMANQIITNIDQKIDRIIYERKIRQIYSLYKNSGKQDLWNHLVKGLIREYKQGEIDKEFLEKALQLHIAFYTATQLENSFMKTLKKMLMRA